MTAPASAFLSPVSPLRRRTPQGNGSYLLTNRTWPAHPAYFEGRFSNGPVWVEHLAGYFASSSEHHAPVPVDDRAHGGATLDNRRVQGRTGYDSDVPVPSVREQVLGYIREAEAAAPEASEDDADDLPLDGRALYVVGGGGNDVFFSSPFFVSSSDSAPSAPAPASLEETAHASATLILECIAALAAQGAAHFLVPARPDLGNTPYAREHLSEGKREMLSVYAGIMWGDLGERGRWPRRRRRPSPLKGQAGEEEEEEDEDEEKVTIALVDQSGLYNLDLGVASHLHSPSHPSPQQQQQQQQQRPFSAPSPPSPREDASALSLSLRFEDTTHPCLRGVYPDDGGDASSKPCPDPTTHLFWDIYHPTSAGHALLGRMAVEALRLARAPGGGEGRT